MKFKAFSLVEILISLIAVSCITAALSPIISKKLSTDRIFAETSKIKTDCSKKFSSYCSLCTSSYCASCSRECSSGEYLDSENCECGDCNFDTESINCSQCNKNKQCVLCAEGYYLSNYTCNQCPTGYTCPGDNTARKTYTKEYTSSGTYSFTVPNNVSSLNIKLIAGGAGGSAGNCSLSTKTFTTIGSNTFSVPVYLRNKYAIVNMCGGGGAGGGLAMNSCWSFSTIYYQGAAGGGSGGYYKNKIVKMADVESTEVYVGGGGGQVDVLSLTSGSGPNYTKPTNDNVYWISSSYFYPSSTPYYYFTGGSRPSDLLCVSGTGGSAAGYKNTSDTPSSDVTIYPSSGGDGSYDSGGSGGSYYGYCGLIGGGGGGGGASYIGTSSDSHYLIASGGGGGGGESMTGYSTSAAKWYAYAGGGGGGGGGACSSSGNKGGNGGNTYTRNGGCVSTGGKGGSPGGNDGSNSGCNDSNPASSGAGGASPLSGYSSYCRGGNGLGYNSTCTSRNYSTCSALSKTNIVGSQGIVVLSYMTANVGGKGGNSGNIIEKDISVSSGDVYKITVGAKGTGGTSAYLNSSGNTVSSSNATDGGVSSVYKGSTLVFSTESDGSSNVLSSSATLEGGTDGAKLSGVTTCTVGAAGSADDNSGSDAANYGGCGGGGGYVCSDGGDGSPGYAKITYEEVITY